MRADNWEVGSPVCWASPRMLDVSSVLAQVTENSTLFVSLFLDDFYQFELPIFITRMKTKSSSAAFFILIFNRENTAKAASINHKIFFVRIRMA